MLKAVLPQKNLMMLLMSAIIIFKSSLISLYFYYTVFNQIPLNKWIFSAHCQFLYTWFAKVPSLALLSSFCSFSQRLNLSPAFAYKVILVIFNFTCCKSFPHSSVGKESACNAGDPGLILGSGRSPEVIGYPLQCSWASLVGPLVKNPSATWEIWVGTIPQRREGYPLQYSGLENSMDCIVHGVAKSQTRLSDFHFHLVIKSYRLLLKNFFHKFPSFHPLT